MRRSAVPLVLAFVLGLAAAFAASCTGGVDGGLPQSDADELKSQISDVQEFVDRGDCDGIDGQLRQVQQAIDNLPPSTDEALVENLRQGAEQLESTAISACNSQTQTETQTQPQETVTEAVPTITETAPTTPTQTVPPETTPPDTVPPETPTTPAEPAPDEQLPEETPEVPSEENGGAGVQP